MHGVIEAHLIVVHYIFITVPGEFVNATFFANGEQRGRKDTSDRAEWGVRMERGEKEVRGATNVRKRVALEKASYP